MKRVGVLFLVVAFATLWGTLGTAAERGPVIFSNQEVFPNAEPGDIDGLPVGHFFMKYGRQEALGDETLQVQIEMANYEPVGLSLEIDYGGSVTEYTYDLIGRRVAIAQPAEGEVYQLTLTSEDFGDIPLSEIIDAMVQGTTYFNLWDADDNHISGQVIARPGTITPRGFR